MKEYQVIGPPGTGKTTYLANQIKHFSETGYQPDEIIVCSLTTTAASEIGNRSKIIPGTHAATLHAFCARELKNPIIAETKVAEWNHFHPEMILTDINATVDDSIVGNNSDSLLQKVNLYRAKMTDWDNWDRETKSFFQKWEEWKQDYGYVDFADLIQKGIDEINIPFNARVMLADEVQDYSKAEATLIRKWGEQAEMFIIVGDPDQLLYEWRGADPDLFKHPHAKRKILQQSYRVPALPLEYSRKWIEQIKDREKIDYNPTQKTGEVRKINAKYTDIKPIIEEIMTFNGSVMLLTTTNKMSYTIASQLRKEGLMFHNPYRMTESVWNPLENSKIKTILANYFDILKTGKYWKFGDFFEIVNLMYKKYFKYSPEDFSGIDLEARPNDKWLNNFFADCNSKEMFYSCEPDIIYEMMTAAGKKRCEYSFEIIKNKGIDYYVSKPQIIIGTIHSVKGGEADRVYLFPDLSPAAQKQWFSDAGRSAVIRTFYVGMTRTKDELILCQPATMRFIKWLKG